jgi:dCTP deaminase
MSTLSDRDIISLSRRGELIAEEFREESVTPNGYDLRASIIRINGNDKDHETISSNKHFLVATLEYLKLPDDIMGQIWVRSSYARRGILGSFGAVDAGYHGTLTLSFFHSGSEDLEITKGDRIAQIVFHRMESVPEKTYSQRSGNYQGSRGIMVKGSK